MEVRATAKYVRVQPRKVRIIADELRGRPAGHSSALLQYHSSKGARLLRKVLESAIANAKENHGFDREELRISTIMIDEGPVLKRMRARAMGRGFRIEKKTSHITVIVEDYEPEQKTKQKSKAKPRPTFAAPAGKKGGKKKAAKAEEESTAPTVEEAEEPKVEASAEAPQEPVQEETPATVEETKDAEPAAEEQNSNESEASAEAEQDSEKGAE